MRNKFPISNFQFQINTNIIREIVKKTREDVEKRKKNVPFSVILNSNNRHPEFISGSKIYEMLNQVQHDTEYVQHDTLRKGRGSFESAMSAPKKGNVAIIAEIKLASPSESLLGSEDNLIERVKQYEEAGVDAISVVTEKHFFKGDPSFISKVKQAVSISVLQKDFVIDEYQIYEAKKMGADAILLIARLVEKKVLKHFVELCFAGGIEPVVEVHKAEDLEKALATSTKIIAVNARDLDTFAVDVKKACKLLKSIPKKYIRLGFSGVSSRREKEQYEKAGASGILIGTSLMQTANISDFIGGLR